MNTVYPKNHYEETINLLADPFNYDSELAIDPYRLNKYAYAFDEDLHRASYVSESGNLIIRKAHKTDLFLAVAVNDDDAKFIPIEEESQEKMMSPTKDGKTKSEATTASSSVDITTGSQEMRTILSQNASGIQTRSTTMTKPQSQQRQTIQNNKQLRIFSKPATRILSNAPSTTNTGTIRPKIAAANNVHSASLTPANKSTLTSNQRHAMPRKTVVDNRKAILQPIETQSQSSVVTVTKNKQAASFKITRNKYNTKSSKNKGENSQQAEIPKPVEPKTCRICLEVITKKGDPSTKLPGCKSVFHTECLKYYSLQAIEDRNVPIKCPDVDCKKILPKATLGTFLNEDQMKFYAKQKLKAEALRNPNAYVFCPTPDCEHIFIVPKRMKEEENLRFQTCPICAKIICLI